MADTTINPHVSEGPMPPHVRQQLSWFADAIERAVAGGWNTNLLEDDWHVHPSAIFRPTFCFPRPAEKLVTHWDAYQIIYAHDFAQALWGREPIYGPDPQDSDDLKFGPPAWEYHLQHMVLMVDPLWYIEVNK